MKGNRQSKSVQQYSCICTGRASLVKQPAMHIMRLSDTLWAIRWGPKLAAKIRTLKTHPESGSLMAKSLPKETLAFGPNYVVLSSFVALRRCNTCLPCRQPADVGNQFCKRALSESLRFLGFSPTPMGFERQDWGFSKQPMVSQYHYKEIARGFSSRTWLWLAPNASSQRDRTLCAFRTKLDNFGWLWETPRCFFFETWVAVRIRWPKIQWFQSKFWVHPPFPDTTI